LLEDSIEPTPAPVGNEPARDVVTIAQAAELLHVSIQYVEGPIARSLPNFAAALRPFADRL